MAIRYSRPYDEILDELSRALEDIPDCYETFEMTPEEWNELAKPERDVCIRTLADDMFYVLGSSPHAEAGSGKLEYDKAHGVIKVMATPQLVHLVALK
ncbi:hypothetical protein [Cohnella sp. AR92]|uniref:hypothetical protein n=1 Tax=Cohnella sp. AR92 TaxID=648716 RepID=UPI000F8E0CBE|nr:hypothetical protein [Cohnella sp. AR92]RUS46763.1 hypothetical protein ELR57_13800 [Cohnella sp. AR92]